MDWKPHLKNLSHHLIGNLDDEELQGLREHSNINDYLGRTPSKPECIENTENRLGFKLPDSLTSFYRTSDGWDFR